MSNRLKSSISGILILTLILSSLIIINTDDTYAASKKTKKVKVVFNKNGGKLAKKSKVVKVGKKYGKLPTPKRSGYTFKGWYNKKTGGKKVTAKTKVRKKKKHTIYARWKKKATVSLPKQVFALVNSERAKAGVAPLAWSDEIGKYASIRAEEISRFFSHTRPDGSDWYSLAPNILHGENIAAGQPTAKDVMNSWMDSPGHKANILNPDYKYIGVGYLKNVHSPVGYTNYWVQLFSWGV